MRMLSMLHMVHMLGLSAQLAYLDRAARHLCRLASPPHTSQTWADYDSGHSAAIQ